MAQAAISRLSGLAGKARSTIEPSYKFAEKHVVDQYHKTMQANKQYVVQDQAAADKLFRQWFFTKMSRIPQTVDASHKEWAELKGQWAKRSDLHLAEVGTQLLFVGEVYAWFCVGEVIGRGGSLSGYNI
ncbi:hypothetical protein WJX79_000230 [Trebouxia sp. C0005]|nr:MAG: hypothetical protein FRX49_10154 [Trebouxia sp. A1-2]